MIKCPECGCRRIWKAGHYRGLQRWQCSRCLHRFTDLKVKFNVTGQVLGDSDPREYVEDSLVFLTTQKPFEPLPFNRSKDIASHSSPIVEEHLNSLLPYNRGQVKLTHNQRLKTVQAPSKMAAKDFKGKLVEFAFYFKKKGRSESTIKGQCGSLRTLYNLGANLLNPESVKETVALQEWSNGMRKNVINAYKNFAESQDIPLPEMPEYKPKSKLPFIPNESELDQLIACAGPKLQPYLRTVKETFARAGEIAALKWRDVDLERQVITINDAEKNSNPRPIEISDKLVVMLKRIPKEGELVFGENAAKRMRQLFHWTRTRLAFRTQNPRIKQIHLHSFRHWGATMLYHDTKDPFLVMERLGHKSITSTQIYIKLLKTGNREEYVSKVATTLEEAQTLIESGFEYITDMKHGQMTYKLFRKKKPWRPS